MSRLPFPLRSALERFDTALVTGGYRAVSVPTERVRGWLRFRGLAFAGSQGDAPSLASLDRSAEAVIRRAQIGTSAMSGAAGLGGAASIAPEAVGTTVAVLRLAQRLCVVYGFDPETDRGKMAMWRALATAYDVQLPSVGPADLRVSDLPAVFTRSRAPRTVAGALTRAMVGRSLGWAASRFTRFIPVLAASRSAADARRHVDEVGVRMQAVLRRLAEVPHNEEGRLEDAHELEP